MSNTKKSFVRHFRIYFKNNHPAYIVDEEGNKYVFHRVTHSKTSGGRKNWKKKNSLIKGGEGPMYIVKQELRDKKNRFSPYQLSVKPNADISYPDIKKAGSTQIHQNDRATNATSKTIKTNQKRKSNKKQKE